MAGMDNVVVNVRERPHSSDINDLQSMIHRNVLEIFRHGFASCSIVNGMPTGTPRNAVLGGFEVTPNGNDASIAPGVLMQDTLVAPFGLGLLDTPYRFGAIRVPETRVMPAPGSTTYYLLEAQVEDVSTEIGSRDILDPGTGIFGPQFVTKRREHRIITQLLTGTATAAPVPSAADWVPLAIIRRPAGGGPVVATDIIDVRPAWRDAVESDFPIGDSGLGDFRFRRGRMETTATPSSPSSLINVMFEGLVKGQHPLVLRANHGASFDPTSATYLEPGTVLSANTWYYLYLLPWNGLAPWRGDVSSNTPDKGVLVLSSQDPSNLTNGNQIVQPAPFSNESVATGVLVCALRRNAANNGWVSMVSTDSIRFAMQSFGATVVSSGSGAGPFTHDHSIAGLLPIEARVAKLMITVQLAASISGTLNVEQNAGAATPYHLQYMFEGRTAVVMDWPMRLGDIVELTVSLGAASAVTTIVQIIGYEL